MTVLTKTKKRYPRPRCECQNAQRQRCKLSAVEYVRGKACCHWHAIKARNPFEVVA